MNIRYDRIIAWGVLLLITIMLSSFAISAMVIGTSNDSPTTSIEESNISIPEDNSVTIYEETEENIIIEELIQKPLPIVDYTSPIVDYKRVYTDSKRTMNKEVEHLSSKLGYINHMAGLAIAYGYENDSPIIQEITNDYNTINNHISYYNQQIAKVDEIRFTASAAEYPAATEIWQYLKSLGYNDYVCAGIMGNLMAEVGGQTLDIHFWIYDDTYEYYGMCQWALKYCPEVEGLRLEGQLKYLADTIESSFKYYGKNYATNFDYNSFLKLENEQEAALAFAKVYERCGSGSYNKRKENATKAYNYFVG